jgi:hypothetical protein
MSGRLVEPLPQRVVLWEGFLLHLDVRAVDCSLGIVHWDVVPSELQSSFGPSIIVQQAVFSCVSGGWEHVVPLE